VYFEIIPSTYNKAYNSESGYTEHSKRGGMVNVSPN
jgi:hypothetical protein